TNNGANGLNAYEVPGLGVCLAPSIGNSFTALGTAFDQFSVIWSTNTMPSHTHALPVAPTLTSLQRLGDGSFQFSFINLPDNTFTVLTSTNVALALSNWTNLGTITNSPPAY